VTCVQPRIAGSFPDVGYATERSFGVVKIHGRAALPAVACYSVTTVHGAPSSEAPAERALRLAGAKALKDAEVVEVDPAEIDHRSVVRFDLATRKIVTAPRPSADGFRSGRA